MSGDPGQTVRQMNFRFGEPRPQMKPTP